MTQRSHSGCTHTMIHRFCIAVAAIGFVFLSTRAHAESEKPRELLAKSKRVLFLGDSITAAGGYVTYFEAWLATQGMNQHPEILSAGLPSETVSGLSEDGHAGGQFPRPDLAERLSRVLDVTKPDLVFACYGMNCGIYKPFDDARFEQYQRGIENLKKTAEQAGAQIVFLTPPFYDDLRKPNKFSYNDVLDRYSQWLLDQRKAGWQVVDLHDGMAREIKQRRQSDPQFTFQPDAVHPNEEGHWCMAQQLIKWFGDDKAAACETPAQMLALYHVPETILPLVRQRVNILRDAYVSAAGHKRPGVAAGLPVAEAQQKAAKLTAEIEKLLPGRR
jgi:lysophospholipase L1-like esterase